VGFSVFVRDAVGFSSGLKTQSRGLLWLSCIIYHKVMLSQNAPGLAEQNARWSLAEFKQQQNKVRSVCVNSARSRG